MSQTEAVENPKGTRIPNPKEIIRQWDGPLTRDLLLEPGSFGLGMTHKSLAPESTTTATCGYCSTGCGLRIHLRDGESVGLTPETSYPVNLGMACPKGWEALNVLQSDDRATHPLIRDPDGSMRRASWHDALTLFSERFKAIGAEHGPESVAFLSTGQIPSEEMAFLGSLAKFGMGMAHGDGNTRQCMATAVTAYKESFGFDAPPYTYQDFEESDVLVFVGANPCIGHPILWERVLRNQKSPEIIVLDPRRTETAMAATQHLQLQPKSDLALLYGLTRIIIERGWVDRNFVDAHTTGFDDLAAFVDRFTIDHVTEVSGLSESQLLRAAESIAKGKAVSLWWTMGVNQSYEGTRTAQAIINLALLTGNIGKPGTGANSITGQCNAMGSRLWSNTTNLIGGHKLDNPEHRAKVSEILGIDESVIPQQNGWSYDRIFEGIRSGDIRGLWIIATNPAHSWIDQDDARELLDRLDFLVVQDMYHSTDTASHADLILPAAGWGEKEGTFINSERRISLLKKVAKAPGEALADFSIFRAIAHYWGCGDMFAKWTSPAAVFEILQQLSRHQPCDISGIEGYQMLDTQGGVQWPWTKEDSEQAEENGSPSEKPRDPEQQRRLFADGKFFTSDGRAKLIFEEPQGMPEAPDESYPFILLTGRGTVSQWHTQTRTSKSPVLRKLYPKKAFAEINPLDAKRLGILNGSEIEVQSRRGTVTVTAYITGSVADGQIFIPMHYEEANRLTLSHFDPYSRQPSYKDSAVSIRSLSSDTLKPNDV